MIYKVGVCSLAFAKLHTPTKYYCREATRPKQINCETRVDTPVWLRNRKHFMDDFIGTMDAIGEALARADRVVVMTHVGPDGDALGSLTAVGQVLRKMKKSVTMAVDEGMIDRFDYLPLADRVLPEMDFGKSDYDVLIAVDCGDEKRMGRCYENVVPKPPVINIDHHVTNTMFGELNLVPHNTPQPAKCCSICSSI